MHFFNILPIERLDKIVRRLENRNTVEMSTNSPTVKSSINVNGFKPEGHGNEVTNVAAATAFAGVVAVSQPLPSLGQMCLRALVTLSYRTPPLWYYVKWISSW